METKYIPYELAQAIHQAGIEEANTSELVYCNCPEWDSDKPLEITRKVADLIKSHSKKADIYPRYTIDEALRLMRETFNFHAEIHAKKNGKWSYSLVDMNDYTELLEAEGIDVSAINEDNPEQSEYPHIDAEEDKDSYDAAVIDAVFNILAYNCTTETDEPAIMPEEEYIKFCNEAESWKVYDGRGIYDLYVCDKCHHKVVTTYADKGVTPFTMKCHKCDGFMTHVASNTFAPGGKVLKWVRPTYQQYCNLSPGMRQHVEDGGLVLENKLTTPENQSE